MYVLSVYVLLVACSDDNSVALSAGVLCGNCRDGYGVSVLLNKCVTCHDASGILIAVLGESQKISYYSLGVLWLNVTSVLQFY